MRNAMKIAKWEIKRNLKNKSFIIGLFLTPVLVFGFMLLGSIFGDSEEDHASKVYIHDEIGVMDQVKATAEQYGLDWKIKQTDTNEADAKQKLLDKEDTAYIYLDEDTIKRGTAKVFTSEEISPQFMDQVQLLQAPVQQLQGKKLGLSDEQLKAISKGVDFQETKAKKDAGSDTEKEDLFQKLTPILFAGIILLSIIFTGMYIFQSASQEKKDKIAEIILSSVTPGELMQGKIIGYFILGIIQAAVFLAFAMSFAMWKWDIPVLEYLFVPETLLLVGIAILGYLLFASMFVGLGATMADMGSAGQFQGMVMMLPFLPFIFIGPVISDPSGLFAQIGTYIPFTAPGVLLLRLVVLDAWPWMQISVTVIILVISIWIMMKLAGKIFKVGILLYGKNATPREIWKWIKA